MKGINKNFVVKCSWTKKEKRKKLLQEAINKNATVYLETFGNIAYYKKMKIGRFKFPLLLKEPYEYYGVEVCKIKMSLLIIVHLFKKKFTWRDDKEKLDIICNYISNHEDEIVHGKDDGEDLMMYFALL